MNETYRKASIAFELDRAIKYLRLGLAEVQKITSANDFYDPVFIYLSGGLERLFKTMLCLNYIETYGKTPTSNEIWKNKNGHDLLFLKSKVELICVDTKRPSSSMDLNIIRNDQSINYLCKILSEYGKRSRYFNLDAIVGLEQKFDSKRYWEKLEKEISINIYGKERYYQLLIDPEQLDKIYSDVSKEIVVRLELFFRALTRQFIFGTFYRKSRTYFFLIDDFSDIEDNQLGLTDYSKFKNHERIRRAK